jgi:glycine/D-amino acid oxidase-like deaminating enzyme
MTAAFPLAPALWAATAVEAPSTPALTESAKADVCVIGGGYAGLSTALHLAEAGASVVLLEAREIGFGGSGRNGGQVIPGLKYDPDELEAMYPGEAGTRLVDFAGRTADAVFDLIDKHNMNVPHRRAGWIQGAHTRASLKTVASRAQQWARRGADVSLLDKEATDRMLGTGAYFGAWIDRRGGAVQPLSYARELARAAQAAGARLHGATTATGLARRNWAWHVTTSNAGAVVSADQVVLCTNAYADALVPRLARTVVAVNSYQVATAPLSDNVRKTILPEGQVSSDARKLLLYFRLDHTGRLLMGGRGPFREPNSPADWAHLERVARRLFPQIGDVPFDYRWCGRVAVTRDFLPHLHEPAPGLLIDIGCQGRGVALQTAMGKAMAAFLRSGDHSLLPLPLSRIAPIPFHGLRKAYVAATVAWYKLSDAGLARS